MENEILQGRVEAIHVAATACATPRDVPEALAVAGRGLAGDRYEAKVGTFSDVDNPDREVTLIEAEVMEALLKEDGTSLFPGESRRNITTRNVRLNDLVGRRFRLGRDVLCEGIRLCEPCGHLEKLTGRPGICRKLVGRGGLRARILSGGVVRVGDSISEE